jgi:hypothetical protein
MKSEELNKQISDMFWIAFKILVLGSVLVAVAVQGFRYVQFIIAR